MRHVMLPGPVPNVLYHAAPVPPGGRSRRRRFPDVGGVVVWVSLDPRSGELDIYPPEVASRLEQEAAAQARQASLAGLGGRWDNMFVELGDVPVQRTRNGGRRDVRRFIVPAGAREAKVFATQTMRGWRIADQEVPGHTEERRALVSGSSVLPGSGRIVAMGSTTHFPMTWSVASAAAIADALEKEREAGLVGLWEWCQIAEPPNVNAVSPEMWGVYSEEQNQEVERAYRAGEPCAKVTIGIRNFDIAFDGPNRAKQVDMVLRKRRHVRRRAVLPSVLDEALQMPLFTNTTNDSVAAEGDDECPVCCCAYSETPALPIVMTRECGHRFHGACVQKLADDHGSCPLCRGAVDWQAAFLNSLQRCCTPGATRAAQPSTADGAAPGVAAGAFPAATAGPVAGTGGHFLDGGDAPMPGVMSEDFDDPDP